MNWPLILRNVILHLTASLLLAAGSAALGFSLLPLGPLAALLASVAAMGLLMAFAYEPLVRVLQPAIDRMMFANRFAYLEELEQLPNDLVGFTNLREMLEFLVTRLTEIVKLRRVRVFLYDSGRQSYVETLFRGSPRNERAPLERTPELPEASALLRRLRDNSRLWTLEEMQRLSGPDALKGLADLKNLEGVACFPINKERELLGFIVLGPKRSGEPLNPQDLKILQVLRVRLESFLTHAMIITQEALNMVKDSHELKNDVNALKGRISWRAMRLAAWWMDFAKEMENLEQWLAQDPSRLPASDRQTLVVAVIALKQCSTELYADAQRSMPIEEQVITRMAHHLKNWAEFGRVVAEGFRGQRSLAVVDVGQTAHQSVDRWKPMAERKNLQLSAEVSGTLFIWGEHRLVEQIMENLIDNAVNATHQGFVQVVCRPAEHEILIEVRDSGCGIPPADLATLFDKPFYHGQGRSLVERSNGVGLYLVAQYARSLGGRVSVESQIGKGSVFRVILPADQETPKRAEAACLK